MSEEQSDSALVWLRSPTTCCGACRRIEVPHSRTKACQIGAKANLPGQVIGMKMETEEDEFVADREGLGIAAGINEGLPEQASMQPLLHSTAPASSLMQPACCRGQGRCEDSRGMHEMYNVSVLSQPLLWLPEKGLTCAQGPLSQELRHLVCPGLAQPSPAKSEQRTSMRKRLKPLRCVLPGPRAQRAENQQEL